MTPAEAAANETARVYGDVCREWSSVGGPHRAAPTTLDLDALNKRIIQQRAAGRRRYVTVADPKVIGRALLGQAAWEGLIDAERIAVVRVLAGRGRSALDIAALFGVCDEVVRKVLSAARHVQVVDSPVGNRWAA